MASGRKDVLEEVKEWKMHTCKECGCAFPQRQFYEELCPVCYKLDRGYDLLWGDKVLLRTQQHVETLQEELKRTAQSLSEKEKELLALSKKKADPLPLLTIKKLIRLCHPDRHNNSPLATEVTQWLLGLKADEERRKAP